MPSQPRGPTLPLTLELAIEGDALHVELVNAGAAEQRVWARGNTWGDGAWAVELRAAGRTYLLRATNQGYTRNVPRAIVVPAGGRHALELRPKDREWTAGEDLSYLRDVELEVSIVLDIAASPEASEQQVALGEARSAALTSTPPHAWLF